MPRQPKLPLKTTRADMAFLAAQEAAIWATTGADRFSACMRNAPHANRTEDERASALGDALLALIALDLMLESTRYLVANRDDAAAALGDPADELDLVWWMVRKRRNRIAHIRGWIADVDQGHVLVGHQSVIISGYPKFSFATGAYWCGLVRGMLSTLTWPIDDDREHVEPPEVDEDDMPGWLRSKKADWRRHRPSRPLEGPPSPSLD